MLFRLRPLRFSFLAHESIRFPQEMAANVLRGAFGTVFRQVACVPGCPGVRECKSRVHCPYARLFEPLASAGDPSGLLNLPRPFVFRTKHLDGVSLETGERFDFDMNLFDVEPLATTHVVLAFGQLAREGIGPGRKKFELTNIVQLNASGDPSSPIFERAAGLIGHDIAPLELSLLPSPEPVARVRVRFVTPTELKSDQQIASAPHFAILAARIRDRIATLRRLYSDGPLEIDFRAFGERAAMVRMTRCETNRANATRRSSRTGRAHPIGGFVGEVEYEGELAEFLPYLKVAGWTGVGRQTVWGKGEIQVDAVRVGSFPHKFPNNSRLPACLLGRSLRA